MVGRRRSRRKLASSHQRSWLWGRHAVLELLEAKRWRPLEVRFATRLDPALRAVVEEHLEAEGAPASEHDFDQLTAWCGTAEHQGLLALLPPYPYDDLFAVIAASRHPSLWLVLDRLRDPYNFGAVLRSAEVFGADGVLVGESDQSPVTPHVARSSAGAVNYLSICRVADLAAGITRLLDEANLSVVAASGDGALSAAEFDFRGPCAIVIGNEGEGIAPPLQALCTGSVRIPQAGRIESLNAAVAAGVLLYEVQRQRSGGAGA